MCLCVGVYVKVRVCVVTCNTVSNVCIKKSKNNSVNLFNADLFFSLHILQISDSQCHFLLSENKTPFFHCNYF